MSLAIAATMSACAGPVTPPAPKKATATASKTASAAPSVSPSPAPSASPSPSPSPEQVPNYFPLSQGAEWVYRVRIDGKVVGTTTQRIGAVVKDGDVVRAQMTLSDQVTDPSAHASQYEPLTFRKDVDGVSFQKSGGPSMYEFKYPLEKGTAWKVGDGDVVIAGSETVDTPYKAGMATLKMVATYAKGGSQTNWYAEDVGWVRGQTIGPQGQTVLYELTDYTPSSNPVY